MSIENVIPARLDPTLRAAAASSSHQRLWRAPAIDYTSACCNAARAMWLTARASAATRAASARALGCILSPCPAAISTS